LLFRVDLINLYTSLDYTTKEIELDINNLNQPQNNGKRMRYAFYKQLPKDFNFFNLLT
jgi:hypothetical protein